MIKGLESELRRRAPLPYLDIVMLVFSRWNAFVHDVWKLHQDMVDPLSSVPRFLLQLSDLVRNGFGFTHYRYRITSFLSELGDLFCEPVPLLPESVRLNL